MASLLVAVLPTQACRRAEAGPGAIASASASAAQSSSPAPSDSASLPAYQEGPDPPAVSLSGESHPLAPRPTAALPASVGAVAFQTPVYQSPSPSSRVLGYLRAGASLPAGGAPAGRDGCPAGWLRVSPFGFVCVGQGASLDPRHEILRMFSRRPDTAATLPYMYGIVRKVGPIYARFPARAEAQAAEPGLDAHLERWLRSDDDNGAAFRADTWLRGKTPVAPPSPLDAWQQQRSDELPELLRDGRIPPGNLSGLVKERDALTLGATRHHNGFAILETFLVQGRRYGLTPDGLVLPIDRLRPIQGSTFHGYEIPAEVGFPFALVRVEGAFAWRADRGKLAKAKALERRAAVRLTGKQSFFGGRLHYETTDGLWVSDKDASRLDPARRMPAWGKNGERWLDVNVTKQTLVAYEGTRAVFATLVSTGEAGLGDPKKTRSTKRGIFRVHTKHLAATMSSEATGEEFELRDIPYVQYFEEGYALHAAYWHDDFGKPRSHGCINLAPEDARRLFFWTEPKLPPGWHSVLRPLTGSVLFVHP